MRMFEPVIKNKRAVTTEQPIIPMRADNGSAGYDFYLQGEILIAPKERLTVWTDIKVKMPVSEWLMITLRSSIGINYKLSMVNSFGIIDSSYYKNKSNDGNISITLYNYGNEPYRFFRGYRLAQAIFLPYLTVTNEETLGTERKGGLGSTGL